MYGSQLYSAMIGTMVTLTSMNANVWKQLTYACFLVHLLT